jgi:hypothetical protein
MFTTASTVQVLALVARGADVAEIRDFCSFMGNDAEKFTLKFFRLLIAESEIALLRVKHGVPA